MRAKRLNESPLGAAALAGTSFPIDRDVTAKALGFARPMRNSLDAVSARDFALEYLAAGDDLRRRICRGSPKRSCCGHAGLRFRRGCRDAFTTGSSIMPQKRNPDAAELVRGKTGRVLGDFVALATVVKGLALAYGNDLQEDKERVFDAADTLELSLAAMAGMIADLNASTRTRCARAAEAGYPTATDLADWIVRVPEKAVPRGASHRRQRSSSAPKNWACRSTSCRSPRCRRSSPASRKMCSRCLSLEASRQVARRALAARRRSACANRSRFWREKLK